MPIYTLGAATPEFPAEGAFWIAPDAVIIGQVRLKAHRQHMVRLRAARR